MNTKRTHIVIPQEPTPDQAKGVTEAIGKVLISLAPAALRAMMRALKTVLAVLRRF